ncbi:hypothetical protein A1D25_04600 [Ursidibacter arcticus]|uniref:helix-turn-helix domain-containing protein n=1 Tax=Ursidibacter arcticus TaxID=1524965 RepID=UPI0012FACCF3|nr:helix-turn-helix transcriptional regulator [Ursidibacter arcticus]KAE9535529.1 hypothetical protein A1D25_04600 [Ursidibacter arcticus]
MTKINERIRILREEHLFSQEQIAEKMGISANSYGKLERGETKLTLDKLEQIANIFDLDVIELINSGEKTSYQIMHYGSGTNAFSISGSTKELLNENEKLQLIISHKDEKIEHLQQEVNLLKEMLALLKSSNF